MESVEFEHLSLLLKNFDAGEALGEETSLPTAAKQAPSKDVVVRFCNEVFLYRKNFTLPQSVVENAANSLSVDNKEASKMLEALKGLIKNALYSGSTEPAEVVALFPSDFHKNLRDLLGKVILENMAAWRETAVTGLVSLPRLVDFDWRVDVKTSSDVASRLAVPSCVLQLQVQETATHTSNGSGLGDVTVELSKETLDTMLDGLGKIRDQLSSVVRKT